MCVFVRISVHVPWHACGHRTHELSLLFHSGLKGLNSGLELPQQVLGLNVGLLLPSGMEGSGQRRGAAEVGQYSRRSLSRRPQKRRLLQQRVLDQAAVQGGTLQTTWRPGHSDALEEITM